jgi:hypothetical protein
LRGYGAAEAESVGAFANSGDAEGLVFHPPFDGIHFQIEDA